jgi:hypothetical protein
MKNINLETCIFLINKRARFTPGSFVTIYIFAKIVLKVSLGRIAIDAKLKSGL